MPWWKYVSNRFLTTLENLAFGLRLSEYHTGYRAFRREVLESVNLQMDSDKFIFDQEILAQIVNLKMRITEVRCPPVLRAGVVRVARPEQRLRSFHPMAAGALLLHRGGVVHQRQFDSLERRYRSAAEIRNRAD